MTEPDNMCMLLYDSFFHHHLPLKIWFVFLNKSLKWLLIRQRVRASCERLWMRWLSWLAYLVGCKVGCQFSSRKWNNGVFSTLFLGSKLWTWNQTSILKREDERGTSFVSSILGSFVQSFLGRVPLRPSSWHQPCLCLRHRRRSLIVHSPPQTRFANVFPCGTWIKTSLLGTFIL